MYIARVIIKNFRSIKYADIKFSKGKNVIVGRNNSGKSNIVKALDIVLGEKSPAYDNYENILETDFYCTKKIDEGETTYEYADEMFIFCELKRDDDQPLDFDEISKSNGFSKLVERKNNGSPDVTEYIEKMEEIDGGFDFSNNLLLNLNSNACHI